MTKIKFCFWERIKLIDLVKMEEFSAEQEARKVLKQIVIPPINMVMGGVMVWRCMSIHEPRLICKVNGHSKQF